MDDLRERAWIGDAVLALYARMWALAYVLESQRPAFFVHFTSNRFLAAKGDPTRVEAEIGAVFAAGGLQSAFDYITSTLLPLVILQWNRQQRVARGALLPKETAPLVAPG